MNTHIVVVPHVHSHHVLTPEEKRVNDKAASLMGIMLFIAILILAIRMAVIDFNNWRHKDMAISEQTGKWVKINRGNC